MFSINSYLQYKNTPNAKPKVLREGVDYTAKTKHTIGNLPNVGGTFDGNLIVNLSDCRPLLSVKVDDVWWAEGDIALKDGQYGIFYFNKKGSNCMFEFKGFGLSIFDLHPKYFDDFKQFNFFDDPEKYSKLLWNCSEEEGWEKIFKLLNIEL